MTAFKAVLAALIVVAVATLPATAGFAASASMGMVEHMDCQDPAAPSCDKAMADCTTMGACALKCFSFAGFDTAEFALRDWRVNSALLLVSERLASRAPAIPFHPPRL